MSSPEGSAVDIPLVEPEEAPRPPQEVRVRDLVVAPHPDGLRLRVSMRLTPFLERPNVELEIRDSTGDQLASATVVEPTEPDLSLTLHMRSGPAGGPLTLITSVLYAEHGSVDRRETTFAAVRF
jgi:hypothetical protein